MKSVVELHAFVWLRYLLFFFLIGAFLEILWVVLFLLVDFVEVDLCLDECGVYVVEKVVVCEKVMEVLRANRDSLMAVLEAFVHDPLFTWRLNVSPASVAVGRVGKTASIPPIAEDSGGQNLYQGLSPVSPLSSDSYSSHEARSIEDSSVRRSESVSVNGTTPVAGVEDSFQAPSNRAMQVIDRITKKLTGQDFGAEVLDPKTQVSRLIEEATSEVNLSMMFHGW